MVSFSSQPERFRVFLCLFLLTGLLSPLMTGIDRLTPQVYEAYADHTPEAVIADIEEQRKYLRISQTLELNAQLPPEIAGMMLDGLVSEYGLTVEELEALELSGILRFTDNAQSEMELLESVSAQAKRVTGYSDYLQSIQDQEQIIQNSILYQNNEYALTLAHKTTETYASLDGLTLPLADPTGVELLLGTWIDDAICCAVACLTAMYCFLQERQEGMIPLLFSTRRGRTATFHAKVTLIALLGAAACVLFFLFRLMFAGNLGDMSRPVQTIPGFYTSPYRISVGTMLILKLMQMFTRYPGFAPIWLAVLGLWGRRFLFVLGECALICTVGERLGKYIPTVLLSGSILLTAVLFLYGW